MGITLYVNIDFPENNTTYNYFLVLRAKELPLVEAPLFIFYLNQFLYKF